MITHGLNQAGGMISGGLGAGVGEAAAPAAVGAPAAVSTRGGNQTTTSRKSVFRPLTEEDLLDLKRVLQAAGDDYQAKGGFRRAARRVPGRVRARTADRFDEIHLSAEAEAGLREIAMGNLQRAELGSVEPTKSPTKPATWPFVVVIVAGCGLIWLAA